MLSITENMIFFNRWSGNSNKMPEKNLNIYKSTERVAEI